MTLLTLSVDICIKYPWIFLSVCEKCYSSGGTIIGDPSRNRAVGKTTFNVLHSFKVGYPATPPAVLPCRARYRGPGGHRTTREWGWSGSLFLPLSLSFFCLPLCLSSFPAVLDIKNLGAAPQENEVVGSFIGSVNITIKKILPPGNSLEPIGPDPSFI